MSKVIEIAEENFEAEVLQSELPVLVDFWAPWCGPCRMMGPIIEELAEENLELKVCKLNVDEASDIARKYEIESIPTLIYFNNGMALKTLVGLRTKQDILNDMNSINMISLCISLAFTVFLGFFLIFVFMSILDIIILALLSNIIAMLSRVKMKASALVNISIHAMTLPIVLLLAYAVVLLTTGFEIKYFNIMYRGISYIYVFTAIFLIRQNLIKQQIELTTIVQKQQELKKELEEKETEEPKENKDDNKSNDKKDEDKKEENKDNNVGKEASGEV